MYFKSKKEPNYDRSDLRIYRISFFLLDRIHMQIDLCHYVKEKERNSIDSYIRMYEARSAEYIRIYESIELSSFFDLKYREYVQIFQDWI